MPVDESTREQILVRAYGREDWVPLFQLVAARLAEHGIIADIPDAPEARDEDSPEPVLDHINEVYLSGAGGFWLAWCGNVPAGSIGAQDLGGVVELRRMYVKAEYRRRGIGTCLVNTLVERCRVGGIAAIELWTASKGPGRFLYARQGFRVVDAKGSGFEAALDSPDEIRMRLELTQHAAKC